MKKNVNPWYVLIVIMIANLLSALNMSIVNVSLPALMRDFHCSLDDIEWVITGYMIVFAVFMPLATWLHHYLGYKILFLGSLFTFVFGSLLCGLSWDLNSLIFARVIQAMGGAIIAPISITMLSMVFPPHKRAQAFGFWGMGVVLGPALGPTLGGWLTDLFGWRCIFFMNLPLGQLGLIMGLRVLASDKPKTVRPFRFDYVGFLSLSTFLLPFLYGLSQVGSESFTSPLILGCLGVSLIGLVVFIYVESTIKNPILDLSLFKSLIFTACALLTFVRCIALFGGVFLLPIFLQNLQGLSETMSGLLLLPGTLLIALMMPLTAKLLDMVGPKILTLIGLIGCGWSMFMYRDLSLSASSWDIVYPSLLRGVSLSFLFTPVMTTALNYVDQSKAQMASLSLNLVQQVGGALGISLLSAYLIHKTSHQLSKLKGELDPSSSQFAETLKDLNLTYSSNGYQTPEGTLMKDETLMTYVSKFAEVIAFQETFVLGGVIVFCGLVFAFAFPNQIVKKANS
jgi:DHA2 family multidrug resistance protein